MTRSLPTRLPRPPWRETRFALGSLLLAAISVFVVLLQFGSWSALDVLAPLPRWDMGRHQMVDLGTTAPRGPSGLALSDLIGTSKDLVERNALEIDVGELVRGGTLFVPEGFGRMDPSLLIGIAEPSRIVFGTAPPLTIPLPPGTVTSTGEYAGRSWMILRPAEGPTTAAVIRFEGDGSPYIYDVRLGLGNAPVELLLQAADGVWELGPVRPELNSFASIASEAFLVALLALGGGALVPARLGSVIRPLIGLPIAAGTVAVVTLLLLGVAPAAIRAAPLLVVALLLGILVLAAWSTPRVAGDRFAAMVPVALILGSATIVARLRGAFVISPDSVDYLARAASVARGVPGALAHNPLVLEKRGLALPALHALGHWVGAAGLVGLGGALMVCLVGLIVASIFLRRPPDLGSGRAPVMAAAAVALLLSTQWVISLLLYLNSHALVACALVALLLLQDPVSGRWPSDTIPVLVMLASLVVLARPEGIVLVAAVFLAAGLEVQGRHGLGPSPVWLAIAIVAALWFTVVTGANLAAGAEVPWRLGVGIAVPLVLAALAAALPFTDLLGRPVIRGSVLALTSAILFCAAVAFDFERQQRSLAAVVGNTFGGTGSWGPLPAVVLLLVLATAIWSGRNALRHPAVALTIFGITALLSLATVREGAYRVGPGDSFNRMLLHLLPVILVAVLRGPVTGKRP